MQEIMRLGQNVDALNLSNLQDAKVFGIEDKVPGTGDRVVGTTAAILGTGDQNDSDHNTSKPIYAVKALRLVMSSEKIGSQIRAYEQLAGIMLGTVFGTALTFRNRPQPILL